jgi:hypothetical protein
MPGATTHAYPYPVGTDPVSDGDDAIKNLAEKVEANLKGGIYSGAASVNVTALNTPATLVVTFPVGFFTMAPRVATAAYVNPQVTFVGLSASPSATSMTVSATRTGGSVPVTVVVGYVAHQQD